MRYTTYSEEDHIISRSDYIKLRTNINNTNEDTKSNTTILRRLFFDYQDQDFESINFLGGNEENKDIFCICIRNQSLDEIYLEKKGKRNDIIYKSIFPITKEECERILTGDILWLKESEESVLKDFYLQLTINELKPKMIVEYKREVHCLSNNKSYVVFDKSIKTAKAQDTNLFDVDIPLKERLTKSSIVIRYKQELVFPSLFSGILKIGENIREKLAF